MTDTVSIPDEDISFYRSHLGGQLSERDPVSPDVMARFAATLDRGARAGGRSSAPALELRALPRNDADRVAGRRRSPAARRLHASGQAATPHVCRFSIAFRGAADLRGGGL